jgi:hypothetical protein
MPLVKPGFQFLTIFIINRAKYAPIAVNSSENEAILRGLAFRFSTGCNSLDFEKNLHFEDQTAF